MGYDLPDDGSRSPRQVIQRIGQLANEGTVNDAGQDQVGQAIRSATNSRPPCSILAAQRRPGRVGRQGEGAILVSSVRPPQL